MPRKLALEGQKFGRLSVVTRVKGSRWSCVCECGEETVVLTNNLTRGTTTSCGCLRRERLVASRTKPSGHAATTAALSAYRTRARRASLSFALDRSTFTRLITSDCHYCGSEAIGNTTRHRNDVLRRGGIDRIDSTQGYTEDNCVPACWRCNRAKSTMSTSEFLTWARCIVAHSKEAVHAPTYV